MELGLNAQTGGLVFISHPATGPILETTRERASFVDVAYPVKSFLPLRLATRYSTARITKDENGITIVWDHLGPSRSNVPLPQGGVSAQITIRRAPDGRSVILACRIDNRTSAAVAQILFPDFSGLTPLEGADQTQLRLAREVIRPFTIPVRPRDAVGAAYYSEAGWRKYGPLGYGSLNALRWLDYGSWKGGLSVFEKKWGTEDWPDLFTYRSELNPSRLRLVWEHAAKRRIGMSGEAMPMEHPVLAPGGTWQSAEFWLTPHAGGWAKGIEVYRDYVKGVNRPRPIPSHVRDGTRIEMLMTPSAPALTRLTAAKCVRHREPAACEDQFPGPCETHWRLHRSCRSSSTAGRG